MKYLLWNVKMAGWHRSAEEGIQFITSNLDLAGRFEMGEAMKFAWEHEGVAMFPEGLGAPSGEESLLLGVRKLVTAFESRLGDKACPCGTCFECVEVFCEALHEFRKAHPEVVGPPQE
jgi:hypothetical protein